MENTLSVTLMIAFLAIGLIGGAVLVPQESEIEYVDKVEYVNNTVEKIVEVSAPNQLDLALAEFLASVEAEEDEAGNDVDVLGNYNFNELEVSKVYDEYVVSYDGDKTSVEFEVKLRFKEDDAVAEKINYAVEVLFEEGEDTEVLVSELD